MKRKHNINIQNLIRKKEIEIILGMFLSFDNGLDLFYRVLLYAFWMMRACERDLYNMHAPHYMFIRVNERDKIELKIVDRWERWEENMRFFVNEKPKIFIEFEIFIKIQDYRKISPTFTVNNNEI